MKTFSTQDLIFKDYSNHADGGDNPRYTGYKDRILLDKTEDYEVAYFCEQFLIRTGRALTKSNFNHVEKILRTPQVKNTQNREELIKIIGEFYNVMMIFA